MERIKKNIEFHDTNAFFGEVLNLAGIGIITLQSDRSIQFTNVKALKIFGYEHKDLYGASFNTLFHNDSKDHIENILSNISLKTNYQPPMEFTGLHKDNSAFPIELKTSCSEMLM